MSLSLDMFQVSLKLLLHASQPQLWMVSPLLILFGLFAASFAQSPGIGTDFLLGKGFGVINISDFPVFFLLIFPSQKYEIVF